jgi:hypothetical protein
LLKYATIAVLLACTGGLLTNVSSATPVSMGPVLAMTQQTNLMPIGGLLPCRNFAGQTQPSFYRHGPYIYQHRGWWYTRPWWNGAGIGTDIDTGYDAFGGCFNDYDLAEGDYADPTKDPHIRWCVEHHRSYDLRTDSILGTDGRRHPCSSPFD